MAKTTPVFGNFLSSISKMGITYSTDNLALVRVSYAQPPNKDGSIPMDKDETGLLITSLVFSDRGRKQIVSCYDGNNYVYFFGPEPSQCSIGGLVPATGISALRKAYQEQKEKRVSIHIKGQTSFPCIIDGFSYSVSAESAAICTVSMSLIKVSD